MKKRFRKVVSTALIVSMLAGVIGSTATAAAETTGSGTKEDPIVSVETTTVTEGSNTVTTTTTVSEWKEPTDSDTTSETQTTITGEEKKVETTVTDNRGNKLSDSTDVNGKETTETTTTSQSSTTERDQELKDLENDPTETPATTTIEPTDTPQSSSKTETGETKEGAWVEGATSTTPSSIDLAETTTEKVDTSSLSGSLSDSLTDGKVTLTMTPGKTAQAGVSVSASDILTSNLPEDVKKILEAGNPVTRTIEKNGEVIGTETITAVQKDGKIVSYTVTTNTKETTETRGEEKSDTALTYENSASVAPTKNDGADYVDGEEELVNSYDDGNGNTTKVVEKTVQRKDEAGNISYDIVRTTTTVTTTETEVSTPDGKTTTEEGKLEYITEATPTFEPSIDVETGITTTYEVEDTYNAEGVRTGYQVTAISTDATGKELYRNVKTVAWTTKTTTTTVETPTSSKNVTVTEVVKVETKNVSAEEKTQEFTTTTTKDVTTETIELSQEDVYEVVEGDDGIYIIYKGQMYQVLAGATNGDVSNLKPLKVTDTAKQDSKNTDFDTKNDLRVTDFKPYKKADDADYEFYYVENALQSRIMVRTTVGNKSVTIFTLQDEKGNKQYAYCADLATSDLEGAGYDIVNVEDANYYSDDAAAHIKAIAQNGYWGTGSSTGSLSAVKAMLLEASKAGLTDLTATEINSLTKGAAMTATQAALWHYASKGATTNNSIVAENYNKDGRRVEAGDSLTSTTQGTQQQRLIQEMYKVLINKTLESDSSTKLITENNFATSTTIEITNKNENITTNTTNYDANLSFTLKMQPSMINGNDLVVTVMDANKVVVATKKLSGRESGGEYATLSTDADGNAVYTIEGLQIDSGVELTLTLEGTQTMTKGVYLYQGKGYNGANLQESQTLVGFAEGTRKIELYTTVKFTVEESASTEATIQKTTSGTQTTTTETRTDTKTDTRTDVTTTTTTTDLGGSETTTTTTTNKVYGDVTVTEDTVKTETTINEWESHDSNTYTVPSVPTGVTPSNPTTETTTPETTTPETTTPSDTTTVVDIDEEDVPLASVEDVTGDEEDATEDAVLVDVEDPAVPLADAQAAMGDSSVPKTGDTSYLWMVLSLLSLMGLAAITFFGKKQNDKLNG
jgi:LPXTG-motif cell wall-anchored protein